MSTLAQQQQALLAALFQWPPKVAMEKLAACAEDTGSRGIRAYQANGHALAQRALQAAYPVMHQLLGDESFADLARAFWHAHPPARGDVAQWGAVLADFVLASSQLVDEPYLCEVAQIEWAMHTAATAANTTPDPASLVLLTTEDPADVSLSLSPGVCALRCTWPVASIVNAHLVGAPAFAEVGEQLQRRVAQDVVVWRNGLRPCLREALQGELEVLVALQSRQSLSAALALAPALDFAAWLPLALQSGLVAGVVSASS